MRRKLSKEPERKDRPRTEGKWKCQALESGPQSKRSNARSSESKQLATGSHAPREALQGNRTLRQAHDTLKSQGRTKLEDAGKMLNGVSGKRTTIFSNDAYERRALPAIPKSELRDWEVASSALNSGGRTRSSPAEGGRESRRSWSPCETENAARTYDTARPKTGQVLGKHLRDPSHTRSSLPISAPSPPPP